MKFHQLPVEIIRDILRLVDSQPLHDICKEFPGCSFTRILESIVYEEIFYGPTDLKLNDTLVSIEELYSLARGDIKASVKRLMICANPEDDIEFGFFGFLQFAEPHSQFLEAIPRIDFEGSIRKLRQFESRVSPQNVHGLAVPHEEIFDMAFVPPNLKEVEIEYCLRFKATKGWPKSLTAMKMRSCCNCANGLTF